MGKEIPLQTLSPDYKTGALPLQSFELSLNNLVDVQKGKIYDDLELNTSLILKNDPYTWKCSHKAKVVITKTIGSTIFGTIFIKSTKLLNPNPFLDFNANSKSEVIYCNSMIPTKSYGAFNFIISRPIPSIPQQQQDEIKLSFIGAYDFVYFNSSGVKITVPNSILNFEYYFK